MQLRHSIIHRKFLVIYRRFYLWALRLSIQIWNCLTILSNISGSSSNVKAILFGRCLHITCSTVGRSQVRWPVERHCDFMCTANVDFVVRKWTATRNVGDFWSYRGNLRIFYNYRPSGNEPTDSEFYLHIGCIMCVCLCRIHFKQLTGSPGIARACTKNTDSGLASTSNLGLYIWCWHAKSLVWCWPKYDQPLTGR